jgi:hypothetical protein
LKPQRNQKPFVSKAKLCFMREAGESAESAVREGWTAAPQKMCGDLLREGAAFDGSGSD